MFATALYRLFEEGENLVPVRDRGKQETEAMEILPKLAAFSEKEKSRYQTSVFAGLAACIALGLILWHAVKPDAALTPFAEIVSGTATIKNEGDEPLIRSAGERIVMGDLISVASGESCLIKLVGEETNFEVTGPSEFVFPKVDLTFGKQLEIKSGEMWVTVAKQPSGTAFEIETSQSLIKVLRTRFKNLHTQCKRGFRGRP